MPFKSKAQRAWMYKNKPEIAKKWEQETKWDKVSGSLPERQNPKGFYKTKGWWKKYKEKLS
tara:strand:- start:682 stop:864 length:183 start_codon:yes stop_codon:yes gene_type:complete